MFRQIWAAFGVIAPRGLLAISTIAASAVTDPHNIGLYSWAVIGLTAYSALTDVPVKHVAQTAIRSPAGRQFLKRYAFWSAAVGMLAISLWNLSLSYMFGGNSSGAIFLSLLPLVFIPMARGLSIQHTAAFEVEGMWARASIYRAIGAIIGAAVGLPVVLISKSISGACIAVMAADLIYTALLHLLPVQNFRRSWTKDLELQQIAESNGPTDRSGSTYRYMIFYAALGWLQSQSERVLLGMWAGTSALGIYSIGSAIGRSGGDAIALSQQAVLRVDLSRSKTQTDGDTKRILGRTLRSGIVLAIANAVAVIAVSFYLLPRFLGPEWDDSLQMGPVLALSGIPLVIVASGATVHIQRKRGRIAYSGPATAVLFAPLVAVTAIHSLTTAAWIVVLRECVLALINSALMGRAAPWREVGFAFASVATFSFILSVVLNGPR